MVDNSTEEVVFKWENEIRIPFKTSNKEKSKSEED